MSKSLLVPAGMAAATLDGAAMFIVAVALDGRMAALVVGVVPDDEMTGLVVVLPIAVEWDGERGKVDDVTPDGAALDGVGAMESRVLLTFSSAV